MSEICKVSDKSIVCEGVENDEQLEIIKNIDYEKYIFKDFSILSQLLLKN